MLIVILTVILLIYLGVLVYSCIQQEEYEVMIKMLSALAVIFLAVSALFSMLVAVKTFIAIMAILFLATLRE